MCRLNPTAFKNAGHSRLCLRAALYFTNHFFDTDATSWRVIRFAFVGYSMQPLASCLYVVAWAMDRWIRRKNRTRVVLPKETPLDLERRDYAADYRREKLLRLGQTQGMSKVQGRGGDHQNVSHTRRAKVRSALCLSRLQS